MTKSYWNCPRCQNRYIVTMQEGLYRCSASISPQLKESAVWGPSINVEEDPYEVTGYCVKCSAFVHLIKEEQVPDGIIFGGH